MINKRDVTIATLVAAVTLTFFIITLRPDVGGTEDSPKFQFVGRVLGTSHSPGYPFYAMATWAFGWLPIGNLAYRINLFSAVCGALSCLVIFLTARRLGVNRVLSVAAAFGAATSYPLWSNSITAEVYSLAAVLSAGAIYFLIAFAQTSASARKASFGEIPPGGGSYWRLYAACALWACGFGNHVTIAGILPAALIYGVYKDRSVLRPRVAVTAAIIGILGVLQYAFIAIRTMQGAPYLEARADTVMGVFDVIIARDVSWARFYQAQSAVAAIEVPMLLNGLRIHMGLIPFVLAAVAIAIGIKRRNPEVLVILGAAAGTLAFIANLWGDVVGFITPVCVQLWPLAALGLQWSLSRGSLSRGQAAKFSDSLSPGQARRNSALAIAGIAAFIVPISNTITLWPSIDALRQPGEGPGVRALYSHLLARSAVVAENYWLARLINYMHFSGEVDPDPNPRVLDSDVNDVRGALDDGLNIYAFEGAANWLRAQGFRFEPTPIARVPFDQWIPQQPKGTLIVMAASGRPLPLEWLPPANRLQTGRGNFGVVLWTIGDANVSIEQRDDTVISERVVGDRLLRVNSSDDGPQLMWGDDVLAAIDRGLIVGAFTPDGTAIGYWPFAVDETPGVQLAPVPFVLRGETTCTTLLPDKGVDVTNVLADGAWWATVDGRGTAAITLDAGEAVGWRNRVAQGRGEASINRTQLILQPTPGTRAVFRFSMPHAPARAMATLARGEGVQSVRLCQSDVPALPATGSLEVTGDRDAWFATGWHLAERGGVQRFRWSERQSLLQWRLEKPARVRMILRLRAANTNGATLTISANGTSSSSCTLPAGAWTDCRVDIPESATRAGINQLALSADTMSPSADRPGDARELSFVMQASRVRVGQ